MPIIAPVITGKVDPAVEQVIMSLVERSNQLEAQVAQLKSATKQK